MMNPSSDKKYEQLSKILFSSQPSPRRFPVLPIIPWQNINSQQQNQLLWLEPSKSADSQASTQEIIVAVPTLTSGQPVVPPTSWVQSSSLQTSNLQTSQDPQFVIGSVFSLADSHEGSREVQQEDASKMGPNCGSQTGSSLGIQVANADNSYRAQENAIIHNFPKNQEPQIMIGSVFSLADTNTEHGDQQNTTHLLSAKDCLNQEQQQKFLKSAGAEPLQGVGSDKIVVMQTSQNLPQVYVPEKTYSAEVPVYSCSTPAESKNSPTPTCLVKSSVLRMSLNTNTSSLHANNSSAYIQEISADGIMSAVPCLTNVSSTATNYSTSTPAKIISSGDKGNRSSPVTQLGSVSVQSDAAQTNQNVCKRRCTSCKKIIVPKWNGCISQVPQNAAARRNDPEVVVVDLENEDTDDCLLVKIDLSRYRFPYGGKIHNTEVVIDDSDNDDDVTDLGTENEIDSPSQSIAGRKSAADAVSSGKDSSKENIKQNPAKTNESNECNLVQPLDRVEENVVNHANSKVMDLMKSSTNSGLLLKCNDQETTKVSNTEKRMTTSIRTDQILIVDSASHPEIYSRRENPDSLENQNSELMAAGGQSNWSRQMITVPASSHDTSPPVFEDLDMEVEDETEVSLDAVESSPGKLLIPSELSLSGDNSPVEEPEFVNWGAPIIASDRTFAAPKTLMSILQADSHSNPFHFQALEKETTGAENAQPISHAAVSQRQPLSIHQVSDSDICVAASGQQTFIVPNISKAVTEIKSKNLDKIVVKDETVTDSEETHEESSSAIMSFQGTDTPTAVTTSDDQSRKDSKQRCIMCKICFRLFPSRIMLVTHTWNCHRPQGDGNKLKCSYCNMSFANSPLLRLHQKCKCPSFGIKPSTRNSELKTIFKNPSDLTVTTRDSGFKNIFTNLSTEIIVVSSNVSVEQNEVSHNEITSKVYRNNNIANKIVFEGAVTSQQSNLHESFSDDQIDFVRSETNADKVMKHFLASKEYENSSTESEAETGFGKSKTSIDSVAAENKVVGKQRSEEPEQEDDSSEQRSEKPEQEDDSSKQRTEEPEQEDDSGRVQAALDLSHVPSIGSSDKVSVHECSFCNKKFFNELELAQHQSLSACCMKSEDTHFACFVCKMVFKTATLRYLHMWRSSVCKTGIDKYCSTCCHLFKDPIEKQIHLRLSEKCWLSEVELIKGVIKKSSAENLDCNSKIKQQKANHISPTMNLHDINSQVPETANADSAQTCQEGKTQHTSLSPDTVRCELCKVWFTTYAGLKQHFHTNSECKAHNDKLYEKKEIYVARTSNPEKKTSTQCPACKTRFATDVVLTLHLNDSTECRTIVSLLSKGAERTSVTDGKHSDLVHAASTSAAMKKADENSNKNQNCSQSLSVPKSNSDGDPTNINVLKSKVFESKFHSLKELLNHSIEKQSCNIVLTRNKNLPDLKNLRIILKPVSVICKTCHMPFADDHELSQHLQISLACLKTTAGITHEGEALGNECKSQNSTADVNISASAPRKSTAGENVTSTDHSPEKYSAVKSSNVQNSPSSIQNVLNVTDQSCTNQEGTKSSDDKDMLVQDDLFTSEDESDSENTTSSGEENGIEYKCKQCTKTFNKRSVFMKHVKTQCTGNHQSKSVHCKVCTRKFQDVVGLQAHLLKYRFCFIPLTRSVWERKQEPYFCCMCKKTFQSSKILRKHCFKKMACRLRCVNMVLNSSKSVRNCEEFVISTSDVASMHVSKIVRENSPGRKSPANEVSSSVQECEISVAEVSVSSPTNVVHASNNVAVSDEGEIESGRKCLNCGRTYCDLLEHLFKQQTCLEFYGTNSSKCSVPLPFCFMCKKRFDDIDVFSNHACEGFIAYTHTCQMCGLKFTSEKSFKIHTYHNVKCGKAVLQADSNLDGNKAVPKDQEKKQHDRNASSESVTCTTSRDEQPSEQLFPCMMCEAKFPTLRLLMEHSYQHGEETPMTCERCGLTFHHYNRLVSHQAFHIRMDKEAIVAPEEQQHEPDMTPSSAEIKGPSDHGGEKVQSLCVFCHQDFPDELTKKKHITKTSCKETMKNIVENMFLKNYPKEMKSCGEETTKQNKCEFCLLNISDKISHYLNSSCLKSLEEAVVKYSANHGHNECKNANSVIIKSELMDTAVAQCPSVSKEKMQNKSCKRTFEGVRAFMSHQAGQNKEKSLENCSEATSIDSESLYCIRCCRTLKTVTEVENHPNLCKHSRLLPLSIAKCADWELDHFRCKICNITYRVRPALFKHMKTRHCNEMLQTVSKEKPVTGGGKALLCSICNKYISIPELEDHFQQHKFDFKRAFKENPLPKSAVSLEKCFICSKLFMRRSYLNRHLTRHLYSDIFISEPSKTTKDDLKEEESAENSQPQTTYRKALHAAIHNESSENGQSQTAHKKTLHAAQHKVGNLHFIGSCKLCHKKFSNSVAFRFHLKHSHGRSNAEDAEKLFKSIEELGEKEYSGATGSSRTVQSVCVKQKRQNSDKFSAMSLLKTCVTSHNMNKYEGLVAKQGDQFSFNQNKIVDLERVCLICQDSFSNGSLYQAHLRKHLKQCRVVLGDDTPFQAKIALHHLPVFKTGTSTQKVKIKIDDDSIHKILSFQEDILQSKSTVLKEHEPAGLQEGSWTAGIISTSGSQKLVNETKSNVPSQNLDKSGNVTVCPERMAYVVETAEPNSQSSTTSRSLSEFSTAENMPDIGFLNHIEGKARSVSSSVGVCSEGSSSGIYNEENENDVPEQSGNEFIRVVQFYKSDSGCSTSYEQENKSEQNISPEGTVEKCAVKGNWHSRDFQQTSESSDSGTGQRLQSSSYEECQKRKIHDVSGCGSADDEVKKIKFTNETLLEGNSTFEENNKFCVLERSAGSVVPKIEVVDSHGCNSQT